MPPHPKSNHVSELNCIGQTWNNTPNIFGECPTFSPKSDIGHNRNAMWSWFLAFFTKSLAHRLPQKWSSVIQFHKVPGQGSKVAAGPGQEQRALEHNTQHTLHVLLSRHCSSTLLHRQHVTLASAPVRLLASAKKCGGKCWMTWAVLAMTTFGKATCGKSARNLARLLAHISRACTS